MQVKYLGSFVVGIPVFVFRSYYQVRDLCLRMGLMWHPYMFFLSHP